LFIPLSTIIYKLVSHWFLIIKLIPCKKTHVVSCKKICILHCISHLYRITTRIYFSQRPIYRWSNFTKKVSRLVARCYQTYTWLLLLKCMIFDATMLLYDVLLVNLLPMPAQPFELVQNSSS
jgi:hypothetical protein